MPKFIDVQRRFCPLDGKELQDPEQLALADHYGFGTSMRWAQLLEYSRVVILAEAGAGKSEEFKQQAKSLVAKGKCAWFIRLEDLDRDALAEVLEVPESQLLDDWKATSDAPGWFFLDSVDELKLTAGTFNRALRRLARELHGHSDRARVIVSCRPSDWNSDIDLATFRERLPPPRPHVARSSDEVFLQALKAGRSEGGKRADTDADEGPDRHAVLTVAMIRLDGEQIAQLAKSANVSDPNLFLGEVSRQNAWDLAGRPLDLFDLIEVWRCSGELGNRAQLLEANVVSKLRERPDRPGQDALADKRARAGAERLAFAIAHTGARTIRAAAEQPGPVRDDGLLHPEVILHDWTPVERQALLSRGLFDPATYGRVRFHHRPVQEYLAASYLRSLRARGASTRALLRLLFSEIHGMRVVLPAMRPIAAWAALWDEPIRREITRCEPEILFSLGDPEALSLEARADVLRAFVQAYGQGRWHGVHVSVDEARKFADPGLADVIAECWEAGATSNDVRELLVDLIWLGSVKDCANLALAAARDASLSPSGRLHAIRALLACGEAEGAKSCATGMVTDPGGWPDEVIHAAAADLFPKFLGIDVLLGIVREDAQAGQVGRGLESTVWQIANTIESASPTASELRVALADLIWETRETDLDIHQLCGTSVRLAPALASLCMQHLEDAERRPDAAFFRACVIASRFGRGQAGWYDSAEKLRDQFATAPDRRRDAFWAELAFVDEVAPDLDNWDRFYHAQFDSLIGPFADIDKPWLWEALVNLRQADRRPVALCALIEIWRAGGRPSSELDRMRAAVEGDADLEALFRQRTSPPSEDIIRKTERREREAKKHIQEREQKERRALEDWQRWRAEVRRDPEEAFAPANLSGTLSKLYGWLQRRDRARNRWNVWDRDAVVEAFSEDIAARTEQALRDHWRGTNPVLWSQREVAARDAVPPADWRLGLMGLSAEASAPGWAGRLSLAEARVAIVYATIELNGFAPFIVDLVKTHRSLVEEVLGGELRAEIEAGAGHRHLPVLSALAYADTCVKRAVIPHVIAGLRRWPARLTGDNRKEWAIHLDEALHVLVAAQTSDERGAIADECARRYQSDPTGPLALKWLTGLFRSDPARGADQLIAALTPGQGAVPEDYAVNAFAALFGDRDISLLEIEDPAERARVLGRLVRCACAHVRREDDLVHDEPYSPDTRDKAETGRGFLLSALCDTPGAETCRILLELANEHEFAEISERLRRLARERAAADAEAERGPGIQADVVALQEVLERPARNGAGLFQVVMDRLRDLDHDCRHDDFSIKPLLRNCQDEPEVRTAIAGWLRDHANGAYMVAQEEEVVDAKRTDIRLRVIEEDRKAVLEVKIADNWSVSQLLTALRVQLVGQYLRHTSCKHGCLLLVHHGRERQSGSRRRFWKHTVTGERLDLTAVAELLKEDAESLQRESSDSIRVEIFVLDLSGSDTTTA